MANKVIGCGRRLPNHSTVDKKRENQPDLAISCGCIDDGLGDELLLLNCRSLIIIVM